MTTEQLNENTWRLTDGEGPGRVYLFLLCGRERALLIDTGFGAPDLKETVTSLTRLPLTVVLTHGHFDHAGGTLQFSGVHMHPDDRETYTSRAMVKAFAAQVTLADVDTLLPLEEGQVFDLGGREIEVIHNPGHSPGCVSFLDRTNRVLYTGDHACAADVLLFLPTSTPVETYLRSTEKLIAREAEFDITYPSHHGFPVTKDILYEAKKACEGILSGTAKGEEAKAMGIAVRRYTEGRITIVCPAERDPDCVLFKEKAPEEDLFTGHPPQGRIVMEERMEISGYRVPQALSFDPVYLQPGEPEPVVTEGDDLYVQLRLPGAKEVAAEIEEVFYPFERLPGDLFRLKFPTQDTIKYLRLVVDGHEMLSPYLPITYGYSRPYHYIERTARETFDALRQVPHGTLHEELFFSEVTGAYERCIVYTPPGYEKDTQTIYPVLYLQHGHGENEIGWTASGRVHLILDNLIAEGAAVPFAVVMSCGMVQVTDDDGRRVMNHLRFTELLTKEVMPFIEAKYRVGGDKKRRGMAGLSMGSLQTTMLACTHPELFSVIGIFSGFLRDLVAGSEMDMMDRAPSDSPYLRAMEDGAAFSSRFDVFFRAMGEADPFIDRFYAEDMLCEQWGIRQTRRMYPGAHDWNVWRRCIHDFAQMIFR